MHTSSRRDSVAKTDSPPNTEPAQSDGGAARITRLECGAESDRHTVVIPPSPPLAAPTGEDQSDSGTAALIFDDCPRCGAELSQGLKLGWCHRCGYCQYLEREKANEFTRPAPSWTWAQMVAVLPAALIHYFFGAETGIRYFHRKPANAIASQPEVAVPKTLALTITSEDPAPEWLSVLVCGVLICCMGSITAGLNLRDVTQARATWCLGQAALGVLALAVAHVVAFLRVVPPGRRRRHVLKFFSPLLWLAAWQRLPLTRWPVWLSVWGVALAAGTLLIQIVFARDQF